MDTSQSIATNKCISQCIYRLSTYWTADMSFTLGLLEQLLDDMSSISDEFEQNKKPHELLRDLDKILAFIRYFVVCIIKQTHISVHTFILIIFFNLEYLALLPKLLENI